MRLLLSLLLPLTVLVSCHKPPIRTEVREKTIFNTDTLFITKYDTLTKDSIRTIVVRDKVIIRKDSIVYKECNDRTKRIEIRNETRQNKDSLNTVEKLKKLDVKETISNNKKEVKQTRIQHGGWFWIIVAFVLGFLTKTFIKYAT